MLLQYEFVVWIDTFQTANTSFRDSNSERILKFYGFTRQCSWKHISHESIEQSNGSRFDACLGFQKECFNCVLFVYSKV